ncbi:MAG: 1-acyl-sn-glycerol-3-phosphate acyltransferase [Candidatus Omnitrophica bacterium]|nr:1-acyl-sn-glycerol-3-phosphate acyltransferase [Candidatus Omnitrophota bacterium]
MEKLIYFYARFLGTLLFKFFFHLEVKGRENLADVGSACIVAPNHQSYLDPIVLGLALPIRLKYFAKADIFGIPCLSFLIRHLGAIPIERDIMSSMTLRHGVKVLKEGNWLVIFPEGTRSRTSRLLEAKQGIGFLHYKSKAPVLPVFLDGPGRALPVDSKMIKPVKIRVFIGKKIEGSGKDYPSIAREIMDALGKLQPLRGRREGLNPSRLDTGK